jgi:hypothetical protein
MAPNASRQIIEEVTSWPGVEARNGSRSELSLRLGKRELGHLHGDHAAHFSFPKPVWRELFGEGRIVHHPVFPGREGMAARAIESEVDVRDVIELMRLNYDRVVARHGLPAIPGLTPSAPQELPFAPSLHVRAFALERPRGDVLVYANEHAGAIADGVTRQYLGHSHEASFLPERLGVPLFVHAADARSVAARGTFSRRHTLDDDLEVIPIPGHTPGATAYLWDTGELRVLFSGDTVYLNDGEWVTALLDSSDRASYLESLALIRGLDFDVLVPWAASAGQPWYALTDRADRERRIDALIERMRSG